MTSAVLAVDAGQTEVRAALTGDGGPQRVATAPGVLRMGPAVGPDAVAACLLAAVEGVRPLPEPAPPAAVGLSGFEAAGEDELRRVAELLHAELAVSTLALASDGLTSLLGALGDRDGAVVAAGTGTVGVARRGTRLVKVDGWGSLLGDAGSGFAIGRAGVESALRQADGRGGSAALLAAAERRYGPAPGLSERIYADAVPTRAVAAFAADVAAEAEAGDTVARAIIEDAAAELALTACAGLERLFEPGEPAAVSYAGNVFRAGRLLVEPFTRAVAERRPGTEVVPPGADGLAGAALLARLSLEPEPGILWTAR